jgi:hypothetical protein
VATGPSSSGLPNVTVVVQTRRRHRRAAQPSCSRPRKFAALRSQRMASRLRRFNHAKRASTFHRRRYLRNERPSCFRLLGRFPPRFGEISSMPRSSRRAVCSFPLSHALSAINRGGSSSTTAASMVRQAHHARASFGENNVVSGTIGNNDREWKTIAVCDCHDLCRIAGTTLADAIAPLFAGTYVPSMKPSISSTPPLRQRSLRREASKFSMTPAWTQR